MSIAMTAAEMGVLVMGTLHTNGAAATIDRAVNIFPAGKITSATCCRRHCAASSRSSSARKGRRGRCVALEILINTSAANLIRQGKLEQLENVMQSSGREGMCTMDGSLKKLYDDGMITGEEAYLNAYRQREVRGDQRRLTADRGHPCPRHNVRAAARDAADPRCGAPQFERQAHHPRYERPAVREQLSAPGPRRRVRPDGWVRFQRLRGTAACTSARATRTARRRCCAPSRRARHPMPSSSASRRSTARLCDLPHQRRQLSDDALSGERGAHARASIGGFRRAVSSRARRSSRPTTRSGRCSCRIATSKARARTAHAGSIRRLVRGLRRYLLSSRLKDAVSTVSGTKPRCASPSTCS